MKHIARLLLLIVFLPGCMSSKGSDLRMKLNSGSDIEEFAAHVDSMAVMLIEMADSALIDPNNTKIVKGERELTTFAIMTDQYPTFIRLLATLYGVADSEYKSWEYVTNIYYAEPVKALAKQYLKDRKTRIADEWIYYLWFVNNFSSELWYRHQRDLTFEMNKADSAGDSLLNTPKAYFEKMGDTKMSRLYLLDFMNDEYTKSFNGCLKFTDKPWYEWEYME